MHPLACTTRLVLSWLLNKQHTDVPLYYWWCLVEVAENCILQRS
jgi:hypothetical protein